MFHFDSPSPNFSGKYQVKFGHLLIFYTYMFGQNVLPPKLTELLHVGLRLWLERCWDSGQRHDSMQENTFLGVIITKFNIIFNYLDAYIYSVTWYIRGAMLSNRLSRISSCFNKRYPSGERRY